LSRTTQALVICLFTSSLVVADDQPTAQDVQRILGTWQVTRFEHKGRVAPEGEAKATLLIEAGGKGTLRPPNGNAKFSYVVDDSKSPKQITFIYEGGPLDGRKQFGIYKLEGEKLTLCFASPRAGEAERPKEFKTEGSDYTLVVHQRVDEAK